MALTVKRMKEVLAEDGLKGMVRKLALRCCPRGVRFYQRLTVPIKKRLYRPRPHARCINIGGGHWYYPRWENVDFYADPTFVDYQIDLRAGQSLPLEPGCAAMVFSSHCFEHISDDNARFVLNECYRILKPGGVIRVSVPDMDKAMAAYRAGNHNFFDHQGVCCVGETLERKLVNFFASYSLGDYTGGPVVTAEQVTGTLEQMDKYSFCRWCVEQIPTEAEYRGHVNAYDFDKLKALLTEAGFRQIERSGYRESSMPVMRGLLFDSRPVVSLYVEARK